MLYQIVRKLFVHCITHLHPSAVLRSARDKRAPLRRISVDALPSPPSGARAAVSGQLLRPRGVTYGRCVVCIEKIISGHCTDIYESVCEFSIGNWDHNRTA